MAKEDPSRAGQTLAANIDAEKKPRFWGGGGGDFKKKKRLFIMLLSHPKPKSSWILFFKVRNQ